MTESEACDYFASPFADSDTAVAYAATGYEETGEAMGMAIIERIKERAGTVRDILTVEVALFAAKFAFDLAISKIPFDIGPDLKAKLWSLCEMGIRSLYLGS